MYLINKLTGWIFWLSLAGYICLVIFKLPLPEINKIRPEIINLPPKQTEVKMPTVNMKVKGFDYEITPLYSYDIYGLVVEQYSSDNFLDFWHKNDPGNTRDLCLVGGKTVASGAYREVKYNHGEFTCYYEWDRDMQRVFEHSELSNNHLLPKNKEVAELAAKANIGDQVRIRGWLVKYAVSQNGKLLSTRGTSVTRDDGGNGSCETILVEEFEILQNHFSQIRQVKKILPVIIGGSLILWISLIFVPIEPHRKTKIIFD